MTAEQLSPGTRYPNANTLGDDARLMPSWLVELFAAFQARVTLDPESGCHMWGGPVSPTGYGRLNVRGRKFAAHRFFYEVHHRAPVAEGMVLDHLCRTRSCVNPAHLDPVPQAVNIRRGLTGQNSATKTHCPYGHEYTPDDTYIFPGSGSRACRTCARRRSREYGRQKRAS